MEKKKIKLIPKGQKGIVIRSTFDPLNTKKYIEWWLNNRKYELHNNYNYVIQNRNPKEPMYLKDYNNNHKKQINSLYNHRWYKSPYLLPKNMFLYELKTAPLFDDSYVNGVTETKERRGTKWPFNQNIIYFNNRELPGNSIQIHEGTHSLNAQDLQEEAIKQYQLKNNFLNNNISFDKYYDDPSEIYSRLMEFRYANKLDPNKKYSIQEIKKMSDYGDGGSSWNKTQYKGRPLDLLERYNDNMINFLINEIAYNSTKQQNNIT